MFSEKFIHSGKDVGKLLERVVYFTQIKHPHIDVMRVFRFYFNYSVSQNIRSGVDSYYFH